MESWCRRSKESLSKCCFHTLVSPEVIARNEKTDDFPAGFGYSFFNERLNDYYGAIGLDEFSGNDFEIFSQPLVNQPGSRWEYGINIDW